MPFYGTSTPPARLQPGEILSYCRLHFHCDFHTLTPVGGVHVQLLSAIAGDDEEVSPSMLYATAAVLEGCSFVNGGSQNTMCGALLRMAEVLLIPGLVLRCLRSRAHVLEHETSLLG